MWQPIKDPAELDSLTESQLWKRVRPLLRRGNLATSAERLNDLRKNVPSVCAELAAAWRRSPRLGERRVGFDEYLAATLCTALKKLEQEQNPHLYDSHRRFQPENKPLPLDNAEDEGESLAEAIPAPPDRISLEDDDLTQDERLRTAMQDSSVAYASQTALLAIAADVQAGRIRSPYALSRRFGASLDQARSRPATAAYLAFEDLYRPPDSPRFRL